MMETGFRSATEVIREYLAKHEISIRKLARLMSNTTSPQNLGRRLNGNSIDTELVAKISTALGVNFFDLLSRPNSRSTPEAKPATPQMVQEGPAQYGDEAANEAVRIAQARADKAEQELARLQNIKMILEINALKERIERLEKEQGI